MLWVRKGLVWLFALLLFVCLLELPSTTNFRLFLSSPTHIEGWLQDSNIYGHFVDEVISQSQTSTGGEGSGDGSVSLSDTAVQQAANSAFSPSLIQHSIDSFLNANYAWLQGKTPTPQFSIDLSDAKQQFADEVGAYVKTYLTGLPVCNQTQLASLVNQNQDPLNLTCRPPTMDPTTEANQVADQLANSGDFLSTPELTQTSIGESGQPYYKKLSNLPKVYRLLNNLAFITAGAALVLSLLILLTAPTRRAGVRRLGNTLLLAGFLLLAEKIALDQAVKHLNFDKIRTSVFGGSANDATAGQIQQSLNSFAHKVEGSLTQTTLYFGLAFLIIGGLIAFYLIRTRHHAHQPVIKGRPQVPVVDEEPAQLAETPPVQTAPAKSAAPRNLDVLGPRPLPKATKPKPAASSAPKRKPPRLIQ